MNWTFTGTAVFFVGYIVNRFLMTEATKKLEDSKKLQLFDAFSSRNNYSIIILLAIALIYFGLVQSFPKISFYITLVYIFIYALYLIFRFVSNLKKLKTLEFPANYIKSFIFSYSIFTIGFVIFTICILMAWFDFWR